MYALNHYFNHFANVDNDFAAIKVGAIQDQEGKRISMERGQEATIGSISFKHASIAAEAQRGNYVHQDTVKFAINWEGWHDRYGDIQGSFSMERLGFTDINEFMDDVMEYMAEAE